MVDAHPTMSCLGGLGSTNVRRFLTYHRWLKVFWKGRKIRICASDSPFQQNEAHFSTTVFFNELVEDGEASPLKVQSVHPPTWEDPEEEDWAR